MLPIFAIGAGAEFFVFSKFASIGICIAMKCSMVHGITRWVLFGMQCMEVGGQQGWHWLQVLGAMVPVGGG